MTDVSRHEPGTFCWTDLATTDAKAATKFYTSLMGWEAKDLPMGEHGFYTMFYVQEKEVCALYPMMADQREQGIPPNWLPYVSVASADEMAKKVQAAGGRVLEGPFDVMDVGRMAPVQDPTGAVFALWEPKRRIGARIQEVAGSVCWRELLTNNLDKAGKFYASVFGWTIDSQKFGNQVYTVLRKGEDGIGGMLTIPGIPNHWTTYWIVDDCEDTVTKAKRLGGQVMKEPTKIPDIGTFAVLKDPQGAGFAVMQGESE